MIYLKCNELEIRPVGVVDAFSIKTIRDECLNFIHDSTSYSVEQTEQWILSTDCKYLTVMYRGVVAGYFRLSNIEATSCFVGMDLGKNFRGKGIAVSSYTLVLEELSKYGIISFYLKVLKTNTHAIKLYRYLGFNQVSETDKDITMLKQV